MSLFRDDELHIKMTNLSSDLMRYRYAEVSERAKIDTRLRALECPKPAPKEPCPEPPKCPIQPKGKVTSVATYADGSFVCTDAKGLLWRWTPSRYQSLYSLSGRTVPARWERMTGDDA